MKSTQQELIDLGLEPRPVIFDVISEIVNDSKWKPSPAEISQKIITWHKELINFDDNRILSGLKAVCNSEYDSIPTIGVFKKGCNRKEFRAPPLEKSQPWELRLSNIANIKQKLMDQNG